MSYLTQMVGLAVQNFASAAVGIAIAVAADPRLRALRLRRHRQLLGRPRARLLYVLLPLALVIAVVLVSRGVVQTFDGPAPRTRSTARTQTIARGPFASQDRDQAARHERRRLLQRQLRAPLREPDAVHEHARDLSSLLLIAFALPFLFGRMLGRPRAGHRDPRGDAAAASARPHGISLSAETRTTPALTRRRPPAAANMEGKEQRLTVQEAAIWSVDTTTAPRPAP